jgi:hypothetical protein
VPQRESNCASIAIQGLNCPSRFPPGSMAFRAAKF